jgi:tRNA(adenine34) deaminase
MTHKQIENYIRSALTEAEQAGSDGEIPVGAVIVRNNEIIASARNTNRKEQTATRHAEISAIEKASAVLGNERLLECSLFVTKEPCTMCAGAIIHARIEKVYIGSKDEKYGAAGTVFDILGNKNYNHIPEIHFGILEEECTALIKSFFQNLRQKNKQSN